MDKRETMRLQLFMARCGVASRRKCEEIIAEGKVKVNGKTVTKPGTLVEPEDQITLDGRNINLVKTPVYLALNKPSGYLCSNNDDQGRPLAIELVKNAYTGRLYNVGRLDFLSTGLIFFTNDGDFTKIITHPSAEIEKEYLVETREDIPEEFMQQCKKGLTIEGVHYRIKHYQYQAPNRVKLVLTEGKNREIRNLFQFKRMKIKKLHRVRIGDVHLKGLAPGTYRYLTRKEIDGLIKQARRQKEK